MHIPSDPSGKEPRARALVKQNLSEQIYRSLRASLMEGEYQPGERLTISSIAAQYGTSITPVREAIFRLASEKALEVKAASSVIVPALTARDLREIIAIRRDLEGMAAFRVGENATDAIIAEFVDENARFIKAAATDPREASQHNRNFHFLILRHAELPFVETVCENMWTLMGPFLRMLHEVEQKRRLTADNHMHFGFIDGLKAGDPEAARAAMQEDIDWSAELVTRLEDAGEFTT